MLLVLRVADIYSCEYDPACCDCSHCRRFVFVFVVGLGSYRANYLFGSEYPNGQKLILLFPHTVIGVCS